MEYALITRLKIPELPKVRGNEKYNAISGIAHRKEYRIKQPSAHDLYRSVDLSMDSALAVLGLFPLFSRVLCYSISGQTDEIENIHLPVHNGHSSNPLDQYGPGKAAFTLIYGSSEHILPCLPVVMYLSF